MRSAHSLAPLLALVTGLAVLAACGDPFGLPRAGLSNRVDTVALYALNGTPPSTPSAFVIDCGGAPCPQPVRLDQTLSFEFAFDIDTAGRAVLLPTGALRLGRASGVQLSAQPFDSVKLAPDRGYELDSAVVVTTGSVALIQSRPASCSFGIAAFYYAKLQVLAIDTAARRMDFKILVDENCGYRGLEPGIPSR